MRKIRQPLQYRMGLIFLFVIGCLSQMTLAHAEYLDLLEMPALQMASSRYSLILDVALAGDRLVAAGERGHILLSDDKGKTWAQAQVDTRAHLNAVYFVDDTNGWAVGEDAVILNTSDGGKTWNRQFDARSAEVKGPLLDVWFKNPEQGFAVGVYNKIYRTGDGGKTWTDWNSRTDNPDEWHLFAIGAADDNNIYLASEQGLVFYSSDGGEHFKPIQTDHIGSFHGVLAARSHEQNITLALFGVGGVLVTSANGGKTWSSIPTGTEAGLAGGMWWQSGAMVIVGYGGVLLSADLASGTVKLHQQENGLPLSAVAPVGSKQVVVVGFGGPHILEIPLEIKKSAGAEDNNS